MDGQLNLRKKILKTAIGIPEVTVLIPVAVALIIGTLASPEFMTTSNIVNLFRNVSYVGVLSIFVTMLLMSKGLDLSCDSVAALTSIIIGTAVMKLGLHPLIGILIGLATAAFIGIISGFLIMKVGMPSFVVTLGMLYVARGLAVVIADGAFIMIKNDFIGVIGTKFLGITLDVYIFIIIAIIADLTLRYTVMGRKIKLVGTNSEAAKICGINTARIGIMLYMLTALAAGIGATMFTMRSSIGMYDCGNSWALQAITACVVGGTSIYGGKGSVLGTVLGVFFMGMITNIMMLCNIQAEWQYVGIGLFMVAGILLEVYRTRKLER